MSGFDRESESKKGDKSATIAAKDALQQAFFLYFIVDIQLARVCFPLLNQRRFLPGICFGNFLNYVTPMGRRSKVPVASMQWFVTFWSKWRKGIGVRVALGTQ